MPATATFNPVDPAFIQNPYPTYEFLRRNSPVHFEPALNGWFVTRYDDVRAVLTDPSMVRPPDGELTWFEEKIATFAGGRVHELVSGLLDQRAVESVRAEVESAADALLDRMVDLEEPDVLHDFGHPLSAIAACRLAGIPAEDEDGFVTMVRNAEQIKLFDYLEDLVRWRRETPAGDLVSAIAAAPGYSANDRILAVLLLVGSRLETTAHFVGNAALALLRHPEQAAKLREDPALITSAVEELLRYDSPVPVAPPRLTTEPTRLSGRLIEAGQLLFPVIGSAHRDPVRYSTPDKLDITRAPSGVLAFRGGIHHHLVRADGRIALSKLFTRFPDLRLNGPVPTFREDPLLRGLTALPVHR